MKRIVIQFYKLNDTSVTALKRSADALEPMLFSSNPGNDLLRSYQATIFGCLLKSQSKCYKQNKI